ncbi:MAG: SOS response-associated peptidase family protein [Chitinophagaceae bacterium]|nr:SOS response-associated peptidase family protein [Chitinophagaceae bacterium]
MCYYNGCRVSRAEFIRLIAIEKELKNLRINRPAQSGFDYRDWPVIKPIFGKKDFEIVNMHWEYIPSFIHDANDLKNSRIKNTWLNAKSENLFVNDKGRLSMYRQGTEHGRVLVLSSYFFEWQHRPKFGAKGQLLKATEEIPYCITLKDRPEYFFMAGVCREWENVERQQSADTFAIVTTKANELMAKIHNNKERMPVILTEELAYEWLFGDLDEKRIKEIASFQYPSEGMTAWTVAKDFLTAEDPTKEYDYEQAAS